MHVRVFVSSGQLRLLNTEIEGGRAEQRNSLRRDMALVQEGHGDLSKSAVRKREIEGLPAFCHQRMTTCYEILILCVCVVMHPVELSLISLTFGLLSATIVCHPCVRMQD